MTDTTLRLLAAVAGAAAAEYIYRETRKSGSMTSYVESVVGASADRLEVGAVKVVDRMLDSVGDHIETSISSLFGMSGGPSKEAKAWAEADIIDVEWSNVE